jgi:GNAT superfamily N-acetyltransferase
MIHVDVERGAFRISTDKSQLDAPLIHHWLSTASYWAPGRTLETVQRSIDHSVCFGVYEGIAQVGLARVVTDYATFAWLCDVFILESHRGRGLGKWLVETIVAQPLLQQIRLFVLGTRDAHGLYERHGGFEPLKAPERWLARVAPTVSA